MSGCLEVLFVSDNNGKIHTAKCFDPHNGTTLMTYRGGGGVSKKSLSLIGNDYLIGADVDRPVLHVWPLNSPEPSRNLQSVVAGKPSALCVSPNGSYCVAGIDDKIYIWQVSSGMLLNVISRHYQAINKIIFFDDSSHFITAGEDGLVLVWKLADVVAKEFGDIFRLNKFLAQPIFNFSHHSLPVTDIFLGRGNLKSRLFTVSPDQTCKIYCLSTGTLLLSLVFEFVLTAVTVNELETILFVGTSCGKIQSFNLDPYPRNFEHHITDDQNVLNTFKGHTKSVTCLSTSFDGITLASGSIDEKVFLWNIPSRQLIRVFETKGSISNIFFYFAPENIFSQKFKPSLIVSKFNKTSNSEDKNIDINVLVEDNINPISFNFNLENKEENLFENFEEKTDDSENLISLKQEICRLKEVNKQLYQFAMNKILNHPLSVGTEIRNGNN